MTRYALRGLAYISQAAATVGICVVAFSSAVTTVERRGAWSILEELPPPLLAIPLVFVLIYQMHTLIRHHRHHHQQLHLLPTLRTFYTLTEASPPLSPNSHARSTSTSSTSSSTTIRPPPSPHSFTSFPFPHPPKHRNGRRKKALRAEVAKSVIVTLMALWCVGDFVVAEYEVGRGNDGWGSSGDDYGQGDGQAYWRRRWGTLRAEGVGIVVLFLLILPTLAAEVMRQRDGPENKHHDEEGDLGRASPRSAGLDKASDAGRAKWKAPNEDRDRLGEATPLLCG